MRDYNGVILVRNGRVIGVDSKAPTRFGNNDYNIGVELEFPGLADDLFGVTTLKNKVSLKKGLGCVGTNWLDARNSSSKSAPERTLC